MFIVGWSCKDFSSFKRPKKNQPPESLPGLLAEGRGTSGTTFHGVLATVAQHRPKAVVMDTRDRPAAKGDCGLGRRWHRHVQ